MQYTQPAQHQRSDLTHLPLDKMAAIVADDNLKCIFLNENNKILIQISLKFVPMSPIDSKPTLVQVMAWRPTGDRPLPEPMLTQFTDEYMRLGGDELIHIVLCSLDISWSFFLKVFTMENALISSKS